MRLAFVLVLVLGSVAGLPGAGAADAPPPGQPRSLIRSVGEIAAAERDKPWAGLVTSRAPEVLREQFRLDRGAGLVVESVAAGSVAEKAGLQRHDLLVSVDGQLLILPEQLTMLLEASAADAPLECRLFRAGVERTVSLAKRPAAAPEGGLKPAQSALDLLPRKRQPPVGTVTRLTDGTLQRRDADYTVKLTPGEEPRLVVRDARGRIVFNGPIDTPEQQSLVPPDVRGRVGELERLAARQAEGGPAEASAGRDRPPAVRIGRLEIEPIEVR
ncbi:MAG: PDZ domain-containing protein [Planctomycetia bacterium]|nr:PDZ domain-containing protein [Planctomycetia bacterium]